MIEKYIQRFLDVANATDNAAYQVFARGQGKGHFSSPTASAFKGNAFSEKDSYTDAMIHHPEVFRGLTYFERLMTMQHYENNTRLMDVSTNFLIALLFCCFSKSDSGAEVLIYKEKKDDILFPDSDKLLMLSALAHFTNEEQEEMKQFCSLHKGKIDADQMRGNRTMWRFLHEIRNERPAFEAEIVGEDLLRSYFVTTYNLHPRVTNQSGGFIVFGLNQDPRDDARADTIPIPADELPQLARELRFLGVDEQMIKPEVEHLFYSRENDYNTRGINNPYYR